MDKKWWLAIMCCGIFSGLWSQPNMKKESGSHRIAGVVTDSLSGRPLPSASVTLLEFNTEKIIKGTKSSEAGVFGLNNVAPGKYSISIASIGYRKFLQEELVVGTKNAIIQLKPVTMIKEEQALEAVTVTARAKLIDYKIDKLVYNAEKDLSAQTGVATDLLKKVPQVSVDVDGNVELSGSSSIHFLINGKPSTAFGSNIAEVLQSIPASQIKSIEVITSPGAKYDAQGLGGIINIILKRNTARGINSNISLTAGTLLENGSFNVAAREGNIGVNAFVSGNAKLPATGYKTALRQSSDTVAGTNASLEQDGSSRFKRHSVETGIGMDWSWKKKNDFSANWGYSLYTGNGTGENRQHQQTLGTNGNILSDILFRNISANGYRSENTDASVNYKRRFNKEDQELELQANTSKEISTGGADNEQFGISDDSLQYGLRSSNPGTQRETQLQLDYTHPITKHILLSLGGKSTFKDISSTSDVLLYQADAKVYGADSSLSNQLNYHQTVNALYVELSMPVGHLFDVKAGTRYEHTEINTSYSNAGSNAKTPPGYHTFVPTIYLSRKLTDDQVLKVSYTKRIERPGYDDLNPFINTSDPKNISSGNPALKPQIGSRYEISYNRDIANIGTLMIAGFFRNSRQDIQPYVTYYPSLQIGDSVYQNVSVSTRENIGTEKNIGLNLFSDVHLTTKLSWRTNIFVFHRHILNELDNNANRTSMNYRLNMNATYTFTPLITGEFFGNFNSARNEVQGKYPSFTSYSLALRKQVSSKKGSIAITANNPFNEYVLQKMEVYGAGFTQTSLRKIPFRSFGLNFTWKFGKLEFKKEAKEDIDDNSPVNPG